jgi:hypothetical protein
MCLLDTLWYRDAKVGAYSTCIHTYTIIDTLMLTNYTYCIRRLYIRYTDASHCEYREGAAGREADKTGAGRARGDGASHLYLPLHTVTYRTYRYLPLHYRYIGAGRARGDGAYEPRRGADAVLHTGPGRCHMPICITIIDTIIFISN